VSGWHIYPAETPIFWAMILLLATQTAGHLRNVCYLIVDTYRRRHRSLTSRAPAERGMRQSQRPTPTQGPAMPSEDEVTRIGRPDYGPPRIDPAETLAGFQAPKPRKDRSGLIAGGVALLVTLTVFAVGGGGFVAYRMMSHTATFTAQGQILLRDTDPLTEGISRTSGSCSGTGGYSDITEGTSVIVRDADGKTVAAGELGTGIIGGDPSNGNLVACTFMFMIRGIPDGSKFYSFEVSHRGQVTMSHDQAIWPRMTIGS
jgi:hypothetical protein